MGTTDPPTLRATIRRVEERLAAAGADAPHLDARWLVAHVLGIDRDELSRRGDSPLDPSKELGLESLVAERERGVPLAYLLGEWEFWSLPLIVTPAVLVPRPETELLVEWGTELLRDRVAPRLADIGTGSGCLAIALAIELPTADVDAVDISPEALAVARRNVARHRLEHRVHLHEGDVVSPLVGGAPYDLIVSNPPYVAVGDPRLDPAVSAHEPALALHDPTDPTDPEGLGFYRRLAREALPLLAADGALLVELPEDGAEPVRALLEAAGHRVSTREDLSGIERALLASRRLHPRSSDL